MRWPPVAVIFGGTLIISVDCIGVDLRSQSVSLCIILYLALTEIGGPNRMLCWAPPDMDATAVVEAMTTKWTGAYVQSRAHYRQMQEHEWADCHVVWWQTGPNLTP